MPDQARRVIELREYKTTTVPASEIGEDVARHIYDSFPSQITLEPPSFKNDHQWGLTAEGWVGRIEVNPELELSLQPKLPLQSIFGMLEYAYQLESFRFLEGAVSAESIADFYERFAALLATNVLDRVRKGLYRSYIPDQDDLPYLRGRLCVPERLRQPWKVKLPCRFEEHTADVEENQILSWTLLTIARSGLCTERSLPAVRRAYRALQNIAVPRAFEASDCVGRLYNRLNQDYEKLHNLCRFFLEHTGPTQRVGDQISIPFLVNMGRLFELFVARWLEPNLPSELRLEYQETVRVGDSSKLSFDIDLVLYDRIDNTPIAVLDTKYKAPDKPSTADVSQVVAYAEIKGCREAFLVYPIDLPSPLDVPMGSIRVRSLTFPIDDDLEKGGGDFVRDLARACSRTTDASDRPQ